MQAVGLGDLARPALERTLRRRVRLRDALVQLARARQIGADAVVNESILWRGAKVGSGALVEQTVMAADAVVAGNVEVRGAIVVEKNLSAAERQSLGGSMDLGSADIPVKERWWRRVWSGFRSTVRAVGLDRSAAVLPTTAPARQAV